MIDIAALPAGFFIFAAVVLGLVVGSFINVVVVRLPKILEQQWRTECAALAGADVPAPAVGGADVVDTPPADDAALSLSSPRSHCPNCQAPIRPWHNVPVISYLCLRGRCARCRAAISPLYPLVELAAGVLAGLVAWRFGATPTAVAALLATWLLLTMALIDARTQLLPDVLTLSLLWLGLLVSIVPFHAGLVRPADAIIGAAAGYGVLWSVFVLFRALTGKHGMGHGDFKLAAALGAWLGWQALPMVLLLASLGGSVIGLALMATGRMSRGTPMPFGPWLAAAGWLVLVAGDTIASAYWALAGLH